MHVLIIKTSSLGDIIHTFPALTDAQRAIPGIRFDWVVEEAFAEMPAWHPAVDRVIPSAMRRWRKAWWRMFMDGEWRDFEKTLRAREYDAVIDAQGLIKSALITRKARGRKFGLASDSAREPLVSRFYDQSFSIPRDLHAIERVRQLFAQALGYSLQGLALDSGLTIQPSDQVAANGLVFLHGTTWASKRWPQGFWRQLAQLAGEEGRPVYLPAGNDEERRFAQRIADGLGQVQVLPPSSLAEMASILKAAAGVVAVDTGLAHLSAALGVPGVGLYGATAAVRTGILGAGQQALQADIDCSPCFRRDCPVKPGSEELPCTLTLPAERVWQALQACMRMQQRGAS